MAGSTKVHKSMPLLRCVCPIKINQKFTKPACPQTNGKAERVIRTLMEMWHNREEFMSSDDRKKKLKRFLNYYNTVKPHKGINGLTPYEVLENYFNAEV